MRNFLINVARIHENDIFLKLFSVIAFYLIINRINQSYSQN